MRYTSHYKPNKTKLITLIVTILIMVTKELSLRYFIKGVIMTIIELIILIKMMVEAITKMEVVILKLLII
jgi:hypothetical protein